MTNYDKMRQADRQEGDGTENPRTISLFIASGHSSARPPSAFSASCPMILPNIILPSISPAARVIAPFLHRFCTMKWNSKLHRTTPGKDAPKPQPIVSEMVTSKHGSAKTFFGKEKVKFWMLHQPLT